jgi:SAM-dependent methyltransferase
MKQRVANLPVDIDVSRVRFYQGDACDMNPSLGQFDAIHASNLLCRLPSPRKFIADVPKFLKPKGID